MTVGELMQKLVHADNDAHVVMHSDAEGNNLKNLDIVKVYTTEVYLTPSH